MFFSALKGVIFGVAESSRFHVSSPIEILSSVHSKLNVTVKSFAVADDIREINSLGVSSQAVQTGL